MTEYIEVTTTVATREEADDLTRNILEQRLAACVQVSPCSSSYHWQGAVEQADELRLTMKTAARLYSDLQEYLIRHHPYDTPEIVALPIVFCHQPYQDWMNSELNKGDGSNG